MTTVLELDRLQALITAPSGEIFRPVDAATLLHPGRAAPSGGERRRGAPCRCRTTARCAVRSPSAGSADPAAAPWTTPTWPAARGAPRRARPRRRGGDRPGALPRKGAGAPRPRPPPRGRRLHGRRPPRPPRPRQPERGRPRERPRVPGARGGAAPRPGPRVDPRQPRQVCPADRPGPRSSGRPRPALAKRDVDVSVLFIDIVGYSRLSERLDAAAAQPDGRALLRRVPRRDPDRGAT